MALISLMIPTLNWTWHAVWTLTYYLHTNDYLYTGLDSRIHNCCTLASPTTWYTRKKNTINAGFEKRNELVISQIDASTWWDAYHRTFAGSRLTFSTMILSNNVRKKKKKHNRQSHQPFWLSGRVCKSRYIRIPCFLPHSILKGRLLIRRATASRSLTPSRYIAKKFRVRRVRRLWFQWTRTLIDTLTQLRPTASFQKKSRIESPLSSSVQTC